MHINRDCVFSEILDNQIKYQFLKFHRDRMCRSKVMSFRLKALVGLEGAQNHLSLPEKNPVLNLKDYFAFLSSYHCHKLLKH